MTNQQSNQPIKRLAGAIVALLVVACAMISPVSRHVASASGLQALARTSAADSGTISPIRVNAGGGVYTGGDGHAWSADSGFSSGNAASRTAAIAGTSNPTLYQSERWGNFGYDFPVPNGDYNVTLKFAEFVWTQPGRRVFNVDIEGQRVLDHFDILREASPNTALDKTFQAHVADGKLDIVFTSVVDDAKVSAIEVTPASAAPSSNGYVFGVLNAHPEHAAQDYAAGVRVVEMVVGWNWYEPQDGVFSDVNTPDSYAYRMKQELQSYRAMGFKVMLNVALNIPADWVFNYPNSRYVNQYGTQVAGGNWPNLTFNETLRRKAEEYIAHVNQDLGLNNFWAIRIGSGPSIETNFPAETQGGNTNGYWAYDANAQGQGGNLPSTISANPYRGWRPGDRTYNGQPFSTDQVAQWDNWYLNALMDGVNWQINTFRNLGYNGYIHVLMAGWGNRPSEYTTAINHYLDGTGDSLQTMGRGSVWNQDVDRIANRQNVVIAISSMDDSSSHLDNSVAPDLCQSGDGAVDINDPQIMRWSATRWIVYNARHDGMSTIGENPDSGSPPVDSYGLQMMRDSASIMQSCGMQGMLWEFEGNLYDGTSGVTIDDYANVISQYPH